VLHDVPSHLHDHGHRGGQWAVGAELEPVMSSSFCGHQPVGGGEAVKVMKVRGARKNGQQQRAVAVIECAEGDA